MDKLLLSLHVVASIVLIGPITMAASLFPRYARQALTDDEPHQSAAVARILHRVSRTYAVLAISVPVLGIVLAARMGVLTDLWVVLSLVLTAAAAVLLAGFVVPSQTRAVGVIDGVGSTDAAHAADHLRQLSMTTGIFALLWVVVVVLMIVRPGSTTGV